MVKNLNQDQVKSKGEEENKKPGFWERTKQALKIVGLIAAATIGFLLGGPIGVALVLGISAFISHKIDQRDARKNANQDSKSDKGDKNSDSRDKGNKKEGKGPSFWKRALFIAGAILLGVLTGGLAGIITAVALVVFDFASGGKLTKWSENVVMAPIKLIKEAWSKGKEIQWTSKRGAGEETEQKKGKEQAAGQGVAEKEREKDNSAVGLPNPKYSPAVRAENPSAGSVTAEGTVQKSPPGGRGDDGNPTNKTMSPEVQSQVEQAAKPLVEAQNNPSAGGVEVAKKSLHQPSPNEKGVNGGASNQPVTPTKTQGQAAQTANSEDGVKAEGTKANRPVVGPASGKVVEDAANKVAQGDSKGQAQR